LIIIFRFVQLSKIIINLIGEAAANPRKEKISIKSFFAEQQYTALSLDGTFLIQLH
jgi:hypothetical protein